MIRRWKDEEFEYFPDYFSTKLIEDDNGQFVLFYDHEKEIKKKDELLDEMAEAVRTALNFNGNGCVLDDDSLDAFEELMQKYFKQINKNK